MSNKKANSIERVVATAADIFATRRLADVSVTTIAEQSHCSTATIYEVFGSKEGLYRAAVSRVMARLSPPAAQHQADETALFSLLDYAERRLVFLLSPARNAADRQVIGHLDLTADLLSTIIDREIVCLHHTIGTHVAACIAEGTLRVLDQDALVFCIAAGTAHEPLTMGLFYKDAPRCDMAAILRKTFLPLVTDSGQIQLDAYFQALQARLACS